MVNALFGAAQTGFGRLWRAKRSARAALAPGSTSISAGRPSRVECSPCLARRETGLRRLWRALRRLAPSRPWLHEHSAGRPSPARCSLCLVRRETGFRRLWRALRRLAPPPSPLVPPSPGLADCQRRGDRPVWCSTDRARAAGTRWCRCRAQRPVLPGALLPPPDPAPFHARPRPGHGASVRGAVRGVASPTVGWNAYVTSTAGRREVGHGRLAVAPGAAKTVVARLHVSCDGDSRVQLRSPSRTAVSASTNG